ncbi:MAG TPA: TolC family protein, partial [Polyangiaceae bacterium]
MRSRSLFSVSPRLALAVGVLLGASAPSSAFALQPVSEFLAHADTWNPQNRAAQATAAQRDAEIDVQTGGLLPSLTAKGSYTRNQYEVTTGALTGSINVPGVDIPNTVIQPQNQFDASIQVDVPLVNVGTWERRSASKAALAYAEANRADTQTQVQKNVLRSYYTLVGDEAVKLSASKNLELTQSNLKLANDRAQSGTGSQLDVQRAVADRAKAEQSLTSAQLAVTQTQRDLYSLTGLQAETAADFPEDDLHEETALENWTRNAPGVPAVQAAMANREASEKQADASKALWLPTLTGTAQERFSNATAFIGGHAAVYALILTAQWKLDFTVSPQVKAQNAAAAAAAANEDKTKLAAEDAIFRDWQQIRSDIESARSARAQVTATKLAASLAQDRYEGGVATQLDVLQARQDAFAADVARIQAD